MARNLILGVLVAAAAFGCATTQNPPADSRAASSTSKSTALANAHCAHDTGTRIKRPDDQQCVNQPSAAYSQDELERTGRIDTAEALRQLDPRLQ